MDGFNLIHGDSVKLLPDIVSHSSPRKAVIVTDPPFNIGYHYRAYSDRMPDEQYYQMLKRIVELAPSVIIHYPEALHRLSVELRQPPERVISWVYNSNTAKQHRDITFYGISPLMNQVKNVSKDKTSHPCQMPIEVMKNIIGILPFDCVVIDPFMGSGTTGLAVKIMNDEQSANRGFVGVDIDETYCDIARKRLGV